MIRMSDLQLGDRVETGMGIFQPNLYYYFSMNKGTNFQFFEKKMPVYAWYKYYN